MSQSVVKLGELKSACKRLLVGLGDESGPGNQIVTFTAGHNSLSIQACDSSETIQAYVLQRGRESVSHVIFRNMAQTLRFYRKNKVGIAVSDGQLKIEQMVFSASRCTQLHQM